MSQSGRKRLRRRLPGLQDGQVSERGRATAANLDVIDVIDVIGVLGRDMHTPFAMLAGEIYLHALSVKVHAAHVGVDALIGRGRVASRGTDVYDFNERGSSPKFRGLTVIGGETTQVCACPACAMSVLICRSAP